MNNMFSMYMLENSLFDSIPVNFTKGEVDVWW